MFPGTCTSTDAPRVWPAGMALLLRARKTERTSTQTFKWPCSGASRRLAASVGTVSKSSVLPSSSETSASTVSAFTSRTVATVPGCQESTATRSSITSKGFNIVPLRMTRQEVLGSDRGGIPSQPLRSRAWMRTRAPCADRPGVPGSTRIRAACPQGSPQARLVEGIAPRSPSDSSATSPSSGIDGRFIDTERRRQPLGRVLLLAVVRVAHRRPHLRVTQPRLELND